MLYKAGKAWWQMQQVHYNNNLDYNLLDYHVTVMMVIHENERSSSSLLLASLSRPQFSTASLTKHDVRGPWSLLPLYKPLGAKEEVTLPASSTSGGGASSDWFWLTDWQIDYSDPRIDPTSGWQYARSFEEPDENWTPVTPTSGYGWVRRRIWVRVMKRRMDLLKGNHVGASTAHGESSVDQQQEEDYLYQAEDIVQNSKLEQGQEQEEGENPAAVVTNQQKNIQQLTIELRALEEAVQLLRAGVKSRVLFSFSTNLQACTYLTLLLIRRWKSIQNTSRQYTHHILYFSNRCTQFTHYTISSYSFYTHYTYAFTT